MLGYFNKLLKCGVIRLRRYGGNWKESKWNKCHTRPGLVSKLDQTIPRSGLRIGGAYCPPPHDYNSREDVYWQGILLGIEPEWSQKRIAILAGYAALFVILIAVLLMVKD